MRNTFRYPMALISLVMVVLAVPGCGRDDEIEAGSADVTGSTVGNSSGETYGDSADDSSDDPDVDDAAGRYQTTAAQPDLISAQPAPIDEIRTIGDRTIGIRYQNGSEPCSLANVTVTEGDTEIQVALETGLHPNAAAMSCIAQVIDYEIQVTLDAPVGARTIVAALG